MPDTKSATALTGQIRRGVKVLGVARGRAKNGLRFWWCQCLTCQKIVRFDSKALRPHTKTKNCGCKPYVYGSNLRCLLQAGKRFGWLTTVKCVSLPDRSQLWLCACKCGKSVIARAHLLANGTTWSCGCRRGRFTRPKKKYCELCAKPFLTDFKRGQRFCSRLCSNRSLVGYLGPHEKPCGHCKTLFIASVTHAGYCSKRCKNRAVYLRVRRRKIERQALQSLMQLSQLMKESQDGK